MLTIEAFTAFTFTTAARAADILRREGRHLETLVLLNRDGDGTLLVAGGNERLGDDAHRVAEQVRACRAVAAVHVLRTRPPHAHPSGATAPTPPTPHQPPREEPREVLSVIGTWPGAGRMAGRIAAVHRSPGEAIRLIDVPDQFRAADEASTWLDALIVFFGALT